MARILCPECKATISETAESCPSCGHQMNAEEVERGKKALERSGAVYGIVFCIGIIIFLLIILATSGCGDEGEELKEGSVLPLSANAPPRLQNWGELASDWQATPLARQALNSTLFVLTKDLAGVWRGRGTAFLVDEDRVATAYHVIKNKSEIWLYELTYPNIFYGPVEFKAASPADDIVVLTAGGFSGDPLPLGDSDNVHIGDLIFVAGNPSALRGTFSMGILSGMRDSSSNLAEFQFDAAVSPGSSGSPVLNTRGEVIAIVTALYDVAHGQNLNFATPINHLKSLLKLVR